MSVRLIHTVVSPRRNSAISIYFRHHQPANTGTHQPQRDHFAPRQARSEFFIIYIITCKCKKKLICFFQIRSVSLSYVVLVSNHIRSNKVRKNKSLNSASLEMHVVI